jgi:hypothetical protein
MRQVGVARLRLVTEGRTGLWHVEVRVFRYYNVVIETIIDVH